MDSVSPDDNYLWLEDVEGDAVLGWVREQNARSRRQLEQHRAFGAMRDEIRDVLDSRDRIPAVVRRGAWLFNFWQDAANPRGLWRRTTLDEFRKPEPAWEVLLDIDALGRVEDVNWVWAGASCLGPAYSRCLVNLSRGGADAKVVREFDLDERRFVDGGFTLPEAKSRIDWLDVDTVLVGTDFGPGSLTDSGYPREVRCWRRGQPLAEAETIFAAERSDVSAHFSIDHTPGFERVVVERAIDFYNTKSWLWRDGRLQPIDKPDDAQLYFWRERMLMMLRSDWPLGMRRHASGSLLSADAARYEAGGRELHVVFEPTATRSLADFAATRSRLVLNISDNVASRLEEWQVDGTRRAVAADFPGTIQISALHDPLVVDDALAEHYLLGYSDFLTPDTLHLAHTGSDAHERLKSRPAFFDAAGMRAEQRFAVSRDGTRVPYFVIGPAGSSSNGTRPVLLYGYGGFEVPLQPWYSGAFGRAWLARGGVFVVANIRGGGEFGPAWHQAAILERKQNSYDDFVAVAEDLIARGTTSARHLGIEGGSNGGLLVGAVMLQRPELFGAVVCQVPLLDMRRYHRLLAGASWMAEYGDPDQAAQWAWISRYSPYQNVRAGMKLPPVLFITSTRDDRVHPGHARKMAARMLEQHHDTLYYENIEGGHGAAADNAQKADMMALEFAFLWQRLGPRTQEQAQPGRHAMNHDAQQVLDFWFGRPGDAEYHRPRESWFRKDHTFDAQIRDRFGALIERALAGELASWAAHPATAVAQILVLDQFTRNVFRGTARAFAGDALALAAAQALVAGGADRSMPGVRRQFVYLPFEHSEDLAMQEESMRLFAQLARDEPTLADAATWADKHRVIIARFGRFPHRNAALGRASTAEEVEFLKQPGSGF